MVNFCKNCIIKKLILYLFCYIHSYLPISCRIYHTYYFEPSLILSLFSFLSFYKGYAINGNTIKSINI